MEIFWTVIPFIGIFLIARSIFIHYKADKKSPIEDKSVSIWDKYWFYRYIKLVFIERVSLRPSTLYWRILFILCLVFSFITLIIYLQRTIITPPLRLEEMKTKIGIVQSVKLNNKTSDTLILNNKTYWTILDAQSKEKILNKKVKIYYADGWNGIFSIVDMVYEIRIDNKTIGHIPYSQKRYISNNASLLKISINSFYAALFSLFIIWILNRKELPIHRLNRMKQLKK